MSGVGGQAFRHPEQDARLLLAFVFICNYIFLVKAGDINT